MTSKMTFKEYLFEARRSPEQNVKKSVLDQITELAENHPNAYVTFTQLQKFGANPQSQWNTPIGIYAYPIKYVVGKRMRVPFAGTTQHIYVFDVAEDASLLNVDSQDSLNITDIAKATNSVLDLDIHKHLQDTDNSPATVWQAMYDTIQEYITGSTTGYHPSLAAKGNYGTLARKILVKAGYDGVIDPGKGIIYSDEPTQGVFFNIRKLKVITHIRNKLNAWMHEEYYTKIDSESKWQTRLYHAISARTRDRDVERLVHEFGQSYFKPNVLEEHPLVLYAISVRHRVPSFEPAILFNLPMAVTYAAKVIKGRWPELETKLLSSNDAESVMKYACFVIKGRWPQGEEIINTSSRAADSYTRFLEHGYLPRQLFYPQW